MNPKIHCAYCSHEIPQGQSTCPSCGAPAPPVGPPGQTPQAPPQSFGSEQGQTFGQTNQPPFQQPQQQPFAQPQQQQFTPAPQFAPQTALPTPSGQKRSGLFSIMISVAVIGIVGAGIFFANSGFSSCSSEEPVAIQLNSTVQGEITTFHSYRLYQFELLSPTQVTMAVTADWDNYLELYMGDSQTPMMQDDDGGSGLNALLTATLTPGVYYILVRPFSDASGQFTLSVTGQPLGVPNAMPQNPAYPGAQPVPQMPTYPQ